MRWRPARCTRSARSATAVSWQRRPAWTCCCARARRPAKVSRRWTRWKAATATVISASRHSGRPSPGSWICGRPCRASPAPPVARRWQPPLATTDPGCRDSSAPAAAFTPADGRLGVAFVVGAAVTFRIWAQRAAASGFGTTFGFRASAWFRATVRRVAGQNARVGPGDDHRNVSVTQPFDNIRRGTVCILHADNYANSAVVAIRDQAVTHTGLHHNYGLLRGQDRFPTHFSYLSLRRPALSHSGA